mmetsp:Transcript_27613/g.83127  ORF Transcript_27613/g.83127 Transcript_27613/m.83127 type:complete len:216 (-) Transcript_27613:507-1154(-)
MPPSVASHEKCVWPKMCASGPRALTRASRNLDPTALFSAGTKRNRFSGTSSSRGTKWLNVTSGAPGCLARSAATCASRPSLSASKCAATLSSRWSRPGNLHRKKSDIHSWAGLSPSQPRTSASVSQDAWCQAWTGATTQPPRNVGPHDTPTSAQRRSIAANLASESGNPSPRSSHRSWLPTQNATPAKAAAQSSSASRIWSSRDATSPARIRPSR